MELVPRSQRQDAVYHEVPARYLRLERSDTEDDLLCIEEASFSEWDDEDRNDLASEPSTSSNKRGRGLVARPPHRATQRTLRAGQRKADEVWTKCIVPASSLPERLAQREDIRLRMKEISSRKEVKGRWHRAFEMAMEGHDVDRALRNVRDISNRIRQYMFFSESQNSVLKLSSMLNQYDLVYDRKRFHRYTASLCDLRRLAHPVEQLIDTRSFECHEVVQSELSSAVQNEVSRRAEPMELQRWERETDNTLQQSEAGRKAINKKLDDLQHSIHRTAHNGHTFIKNVRKALQTVTNDISDFTQEHARLKKAEKDYKAEFFEQQRRNDGYQDALEKLEARRKLAEGRLQADLETLRTEHAILKRSLETLEKMYEESKTRANEIASWLQVLSGQRLEKSADLMLEVHEERMRRRKALFRRINWLELQHLIVVLAKLKEEVRIATEIRRKKRLEKDVEQYRSISCEAKVLLLELRGRCRDMKTDGTLKDSAWTFAAGSFFDVMAQELDAQADWLRGRHMDVRFSGTTLTLAGRLRLSTPTSIVSVADRLLHQRQLKMMVITEMRRASMGMEEKVMELTQRFKLALLSRRHSHQEDEDEDESLGGSSDDLENEIERMSEGIDGETLRQILRELYGDDVEKDIPAVEAAAEAAAEAAGSVGDALTKLQHLSSLEDQLHHALAHLLHMLHGHDLEELHDVLKDRLQDLTEAWHLAVTAAHAAPELQEAESTTWKIRETRFAWLVRLVHQLAERFGQLRACNEVLWAQFDDPDAQEALGREQVAAVTTFLLSLKPLVTEELIKAGEECLQRFQQVHRGKMKLLQAASDACEHLCSLPDINLVPSSGESEVVQVGPSPHSFVTAVKALIKLVKSEAFAELRIFQRFTAPEIVNIFFEAMARDFKSALPECFRAAVLTLADLGEIFQEYGGGGDAATEVSLTPADVRDTGQGPKETWRALRSGARQRVETGTPMVDLPLEDGFQLSDSRPLLSRERAPTASSRPWTSTPARPSTQGSTRLPSRQQTDLAPLEMTSENLVALSPDIFPEGQPLDQQDLAFELEKQRLERAEKEQEEDLRRLRNEQEEVESHMAFLRKSVSQLSQSSDAWRVGELMEQLEQVEHQRKTIQETLSEREKVSQLLKEQSSQIGEQQSLHRERARILRSQSLMPEPQHGKAKSLAWAQSMSRLTAIENKMGNLQGEISLKQGATSALEAKVNTLKRQKSKVGSERPPSSQPQPKVLTQQEMIAAYSQRVAMRSLWKVQGYKLMQAQKAAQMYCKKLLQRYQAPQVIFEESADVKPGKGVSKKRGSTRRSVTKLKRGSKASPSPASPISPSPKSSTSRGSLHKAARLPASVQKHPASQVQVTHSEAGIFVGHSSKPSATSSKPGLKHGFDSVRRLSTRRMSRASIESKADSDPAALMESVLSIQSTRAGVVPVISVQPASPHSSANSSSSSASDASGAAHSAGDEEELPASFRTQHRRALRPDEEPSLDDVLDLFQDEAMVQFLKDMAGEAASPRLPSEIAATSGERAGRAQEHSPGGGWSPGQNEMANQSRRGSRVSASPTSPSAKSSAARRGSLKRAHWLVEDATVDQPSAVPQQAGSQLFVGAQTKAIKTMSPVFPEPRAKSKHRPKIPKLSRDSPRPKSRAARSLQPKPADASSMQSSTQVLSPLSSPHARSVSFKEHLFPFGRDSSALPRLVAVRADGPGDVEASQYVDKGRKGVLSAAMAQAARMQSGKLSRPVSKSQSVRSAQSEPSVDNLVEFSNDGSMLRFMKGDVKEVFRGRQVPKIHVQSAGESPGQPPELSPGWSDGHPTELAARSSRSAGSVLTTRPRECKPMLTARAKKYFNGASLR